MLSPERDLHANLRRKCRLDHMLVHRSPGAILRSRADASTLRFGGPIVSRRTICVNSNRNVHSPAPAVWTLMAVMLLSGLLSTLTLGPAAGLVLDRQVLAGPPVCEPRARAHQVPVTDDPADRVDDLGVPRTGRVKFDLGSHRQALLAPAHDSFVSLDLASGWISGTKPIFSNSDFHGRSWGSMRLGVMLSFRYNDPPFMNLSPPPIHP